MAILFARAAKQLVGRVSGLASRVPMTVLLLSILIGGSLAIWARLEINSLFSVREKAVLTLAVTDVDGLCGTPSIYLRPIARGARTDYEVIVDVLGGRNRFPDFGGERGAQRVLTLPEKRSPGRGLGRGLLHECNAVTVSLGGSFQRVDDMAKGRVVKKELGGASMALTKDFDNYLVDYRKGADPKADDAVIRLFLRGFDDRWQFGSKRIAFANEGAYGLNVFLYEERDFLFINETSDLIRPPSLRRSYVDIHLAPPGLDTESTADVARKRQTAELELQHRLVNVSTVFGVGVSLLVEGFLILMLSLTASPVRENNERWKQRDTRKQDDDVVAGSAKGADE